MKMKKRKNFITILLPRIIIAWAIAFVIGYLTIEGIYSYSHTSFELPNNRIIDYLYNYFDRAENTDDIINNQIFKLYLNAVPHNVEESDLPDSLNFLNVKQYAYIYDLDSNTVLMDSSQKMFVIANLLPEFSDEEILSPYMLSCDLNFLENVNPFKEVIDDTNNKTNSLKEWFGKFPYSLYDLVVEEIWYDLDSGTFLPIKGYVIKSTYANKAGAYGDINPKSTREEIPYDLSLYFEDYKENYESYVFSEVKTVNLIIAGTSESDVNFAKAYIEEKLNSDVQNNNHSGVTIKSDPFSHRDRVYTSAKKLPDKFGNKTLFYIEVQEDIYDTYKGLWFFIWAVYFIIATVIALFTSWIHYHKLRYFYKNEDYRIALLNSLVHDLKTPLTVMSGFAENLKENIQSESREEYADGILQNTGYINNIIEDVIELSYSEQPKGKTKKEKTDLVDLFKESEEKLKTLIEEKGIKIEYNNSFIRRIDVKSMKRVCDNLLGNAVKYTKDGGIIKIYKVDKPFCHYFAIENSPIVPIKGNPKKLWEPFVKDDESRSDVSGNGLGLAISKNILEKNKLRAKIVVKNDVFIIKII